MSDCPRALLPRDLDHPFGNQRTGDGCPKEILAFVNRSCAHHGKNEIAREFLLQIVDIDIGSAGPAGFAFKPLQFLGLSYVRAEGNYFRVVSLLDPGQEDRSVETA